MNIPLKKSVFVFLLVVSLVFLGNIAYGEELGLEVLEMEDDVLLSGKNIGTSIKILKVKEEKEVVSGNLISSKIPMPIEHQKYLYKLTEERGLDYLMTLALIKQESSFNPNSHSRSNYGYMQINKVNHNNLVRELNTPNRPLDPYVNLNWGTHMLAKLNNKYKSQGLSGEQLRRAVLSAYNKGEGGFKRTGEATDYINRVDNQYKWIKNQLGI